MKKSSVPAIKDHLKIDKVFATLNKVIANKFHVTTTFSVIATNVAMNGYVGPKITLQVKSGV